VSAFPPPPPTHTSRRVDGRVRALGLVAVLPCCCGCLSAGAGLAPQVLRNKREEYTGWVSQYYEQDEMDRDDADLALSRQIIVDVPRTAPGVSFFHRPQIQK
jgi:hypothetical protein